jgi:hypothetical protein
VQLVTSLINVAPAFVRAAACFWFKPSGIAVSSFFNRPNGSLSASVLIPTNDRQVGEAQAYSANNCTNGRVATPWSWSQSRCSHHGCSGLIQLRYITPHGFEDFRGVLAFWTPALDVDLAAKFLGERPPHSIGDKATLDPEDYVPKERYSARLTDVALYPSGGERVGFEEARERCTALPRVDI